MRSAFFETQENVYISLWSKFRPMILKMMISAEQAGQQYQFYKHEFVSPKPTAKTFAFSMVVGDGKVEASGKIAPLAKDLHVMLQSSPKAAELMQGQRFEFKLDRSFVFHVVKL